MYMYILFYGHTHDNDGDKNTYVDQHFLFAVFIIIFSRHLALPKRVAIRFEWSFVWYMYM